jgi:1-acyl-sn-glycerol-3-phosphate acyltransferase
MYASPAILPGWTQGTASLPALLAQARAEGRPAALFPEVARSNGEGVLAFPKGLLESLQQQQQQQPGAPALRAHVFAFG